jgi:hypothetical protein
MPDEALRRGLFFVRRYYHKKSRQIQIASVLHSIFERKVGENDARKSTENQRKINGKSTENQRKINKEPTESSVRAISDGLPRRQWLSFLDKLHEQFNEIL